MVVGPVAMCMQQGPFLWNFVIIFSGFIMVDFPHAAGQFWN